MNLKAGTTGHEIIVAQMPSKFKPFGGKGEIYLDFGF